jgi:hypothetical protein
LTAAQIGFRRGLEASYRGLRTQEFAEDADLCFRSTGQCCFEVEAVERILAAVSDPVKTQRDGHLHIWFPPVAGKDYILALDPAGGGCDGDYAAAQVIEMQTGMQCAELQQRLTPLELARAAAKLGREYGVALLVVERNNHGAAVLAHLGESEKYPRLYEQASGAGWLTSVASRPDMIGLLSARLAEDPGMFRSKRLLEECRTFINHPGGRSAAASGAHDDCVMAMAIAHAVRAERMQSGLHRVRAA